MAQLISIEFALHPTDHDGGNAVADEIGQGAAWLMNLSIPTRIASAWIGMSGKIASVAE